MADACIHRIAGPCATERTMYGTRLTGKEVRALRIWAALPNGDLRAPFSRRVIRELLDGLVRACAERDRLEIQLADLQAGVWPYSGVDPKTTTATIEGAK